MSNGPCQYCMAGSSLGAEKAQLVLFAHGWPKCCGATMTTDSPEERAALRARSPR